MTAAISRTLPGQRYEASTRTSASEIGTGRTPTSEDVQEVHRFIREQLAERFSVEGAKVRILYGGSVKPSNAVELMAVPNVNGALVGGASLKAADFLGIVAGCR